MDTTTKDDQLLTLAAHIKSSYPPAEIARLIRLIEPTPSTGEMSSDDFENLMNQLDAMSRRGFSPKSREAARLIMVMGASEAETVVETGLTQQAVNKLMHRIRRRMEELPAGWVQIATWFPAGVAEQILTLAEALRTAQQSGEQPSSGRSYTIELVQAHE